jgi:hypothetical protein
LISRYAVTASHSAEKGKGEEDCHHRAGNAIAMVGLRRLGQNHNLILYMTMTTRDTKTDKELLMEPFATQKISNATVCFMGSKCTDYENNEVTATEVEYCIASGFVRIVTAETVYLTHISNVVMKTKAQ